MPRCFHCGKEFTTVGSKSRKYCDTRCRSATFNDRGKSLRMRSRFCRSCGVEFRTTDYRKIFCTQKCNYVFHNSNRKTTKQDDRECPVCKTVFKPMQKRGKGKIYCSNKCKYKAQNGKRKIDRSGRHWEYKKQNKLDGNWYLALKRDKFTCQLCGLKSYPSQWEGKRRLVVHHRDGTGEKENKNHSLENLWTLCVSCHLEFHSHINLIYKDNHYYISGKVFSLLGLKNVDTAPEVGN